MSAKLFYANIKHLRRGRKLSQGCFAKKINIELKRYQKWEEGRAQPDIDLLISIANEHCISVDELLTKDLVNIN